MIVTVNKEIKLDSGKVLPVGHTIVATAVTQPVKGGTLMVWSANPLDVEDLLLGVGDLDKISIVPEILTPQEKDALENFLDALDEVKSLGL